MSTLIVKNLDAPTGESIVAPDLTLPQGSVIQVVSRASTTYQGLMTTSFATLSDLNPSITPLSTSSNILVLVSLSADAYQNGSGQYATEMKLMRGTTQISFKRSDHYAGTSNNGYYSLPAQNDFVYLDSPGSTDAQTYTVQARITNAGATATYRFNDNSVGESTITLMEIAG